MLIAIGIAVLVFLTIVFTIIEHAGKVMQDIEEASRKC